MSLLGNRTLQQLNLYARNTIKKRLESIEGVGEVKLGGKRDRTIRINLMPEAMAGLSITIGDVIRAFQTNHVQLPGGYLVGGMTEELIKLNLEFHTVADIANLIIAHRGEAAIRLKQIATVVDGLEDNRKLARYNDQPCVSIGIVKVIMEESRKRIEVTRETLAQAEENLKVTRDRYKEGVGTNTEVLDAESLRTVNYVSYDKANNDAVLAVLRLRYAAGSL